MQPVLPPGGGLILPPQLMETELLKHPSLHVQNCGLSDGLRGVCRLGCGPAGRPGGGLVLMTVNTTEASGHCGF